MSSTVDNCKVVYVATLRAEYKNQQRLILKLTAKLDTGIFTVWIKPAKSFTRSWKTGNKEITCQHGELFLDKKQLPSVPLKTALLMFQAFLKSSPVPVLLVHYSEVNFSTVLLTLFQKTGLVDFFHGVIVGFTHALVIWKKNLSHRKKLEDFRIRALSRDYLRKDCSSLFYDTEDHVDTLAKLAITISSESQFVENNESYEKAFIRAMQSPNNSGIYGGLERLLSAIREVDIREMAEAQLSYPILERVFQQAGSRGLEQFLSQQWRIHELLVADDKKLLLNIVHYFERQNPHNIDKASMGEQDASIHEPSSSFIQPSSAFTMPNSSKTEEVPVLANPSHQEPLEQLQRDRDFLQGWYETYDPHY